MRWAKARPASPRLSPRRNGRGRRSSAFHATAAATCCATAGFANGWRPGWAAGRRRSHLLTMALASRASLGHAWASVCRTPTALPCWCAGLPPISAATSSGGPRTATFWRSPRSSSRRGSMPRSRRFRRRGGWPGSIAPGHARRPMPRRWATACRCRSMRSTWSRTPTRPPGCCAAVTAGRLPRSNPVPASRRRWSRTASGRWRYPAMSRQARICPCSDPRVVSMLMSSTSNGTGAP